jgi:triosephosphate isomerase
MNKQIKVALFTAVTMIFCTGSAIAQSKTEPKQEFQKQQLKQIKEAKAQRNVQLKELKKIRREKAVEKIKLRAKK